MFSFFTVLLDILLDVPLGRWARVGKDGRHGHNPLFPYLMYKLTPHCVRSVLYSKPRCIVSHTQTQGLVPDSNGSVRLHATHPLQQVLFVQISNKHFTAVTPDGYAFSIWGLIWFTQCAAVIWLLIRNDETAVRSSQPNYFSYVILYSLWYLGRYFRLCCMALSACNHTM